MEKEKAKKPFYKKWWVWVVAIIVFFVIVGSIDDTEEASNEDSQSDRTEESKNEEEVKENQEDNGIYEVNITDELLGLEINIPKVEINEKELLVYMTLNNTTEDTLTFYPDQGSAIIGSKQVDANIFMTKGDVSGDIHGGVEKEGKIKFVLRKTDININEVDEITLKFGSVGNSEFDYEDYSKTIELK